MPHLTLPLTGRSAKIQVGIWPSESRMKALQLAGQTSPPMSVATALIDTGASMTAVDKTIIAKLGLTPTGSILLSTPSTGQTPQPTQTFDVQVILYDRTDNYIIGRHVQVTENDLSRCGCQVLLGTDILQNCLLVYDGRADSYALAF